MSIWKNAGANLKRGWLSWAALAAVMVFFVPIASAQSNQSDPSNLDSDQVAELVDLNGDRDPGNDPNGEELAVTASPLQTASASAQDSAPGEDIPTNYRQYINQMFEKMHKPFEFHGYMRAGVGINHRGGDNETFRPPTIFPQRWRLGNETDNYVEATFVNNWLNPQRDQDSAWFKTQLLITWITNEESNFADTTVALREAFAEAGNVIKSKPGLSFWAGQRYYRRHDIHIIDWYYLTNSGSGGGFQDLDLGFGKLHVAYMGGSDTDGGNVQPEEGRATKSGFDIRITDIQVPGGSGTLWLWPTYASNVADSNVGIAGGFIHFKGGLMGGFNKATVQFGLGPSSNFDTFGPVGQDQGTLSVRATDALVIQPSPELSMMATVAVDYLDNGVDDGAGRFQRLWATAGARPIYHFTQYLSVAAELGFEFVNIKGDGDVDQSGPLAKLTVAPQISPDMGFWGRPQIRAYASAFIWGSGLSDDPADATDAAFGSVGGDAFSDNTFGMNFGLQAESWW